MKKLLLIALGVWLSVGVAFAQGPPFIFQVQNNGTLVGTQVGVGTLNIVSGCPPNFVGVAFNLNCGTLTGGTITGSSMIQTPLAALGIFNPTAMPITTALAFPASLAVLSTNALGQVIGQPIGVTTAAMSTQSTNAAVNITGMSWLTANSTNYLLRCEIPITFTTTATLALSLANTSGNAATSYSLDAQGSIGASAAWGEISTLAQTSFGTKTTTSGAAATTTVVKVWAQIQNSATSGGVLTLQTWDVAATGTIQVLANATCTLNQEN